MTRLSCLLLATGFAFSMSALAQPARCELNGEAIPADFSAQLLAGRSGVVECTGWQGRRTREETYRNGVKVQATRYSERSGKKLTEMVIERGVEKFKSYDSMGRLESESELAVDALGNPRAPERKSMKEYRGGKLQAHIRKDGDLGAEDWWNEGGKKTREVRSARAVKDGLNLVVVTTRIFDAEGQLLYENRTHKLAKASVAEQPPQGRLRYRPVVECSNANGRAFFVLGDCPTRVAGGPIRQVRRERTPAPANWREIKARWELTEEQLMTYEMSCSKGDQAVCGLLETLRYETPASLDLKAREAEKQCHQGERLACEALVQREEHFNELSRRCEAGDKAMCKRLSNLAQ